MSPGAFVVGYSSVPAAGRVARAQANLRRSYLSIVIFVVLSVVSWLLLKGTISFGQWLLGGIPALVLVLAFVVWKLLDLRAARASLRRVPAGHALQIAHQGITVSADPSGRTQPQLLDWARLGDIRAAGSKLGAGPDLVIEHPDATWTAPLSYLDQLPGTIDSALRAYSGGRRGLDLSGLDSIWSD